LSACLPESQELECNLRYLAGKSKPRQVALLLLVKACVKCLYSTQIYLHDEKTPLNQSSHHMWESMDVRQAEGEEDGVLLVNK